MNSQQGSGRPNPGGWILAIVVVLVVIGALVAHAGQSATITTCTDTVTPSCYQTTVPVQTQGP